MFKGIEHAVGTNTPAGGGFPDLQVVYFLRVNLTDPDIRFFASPRRTNWVANGAETYGYTMTNFLKLHHLQVAIAANQFMVPGSSSLPGYNLPEGTAFNASGLLISGGLLVSPQDSADDASTLCFTTNNTVTFYPTNWPAGSTNGVYTAVSGPYTILYQGVNIGSNYLATPSGIHDLDPRTAIGISQDKRYLFLLVIDGRQSGYSVGAYDWETAEWLKLAGAYDGANMDGGGSACMVVMDTTGKPMPLNHDNASLASGRERTVGAHFGVYAAPLPGFFNEVKPLPDDTAATLTWTTVEPVTTQVQYGLTTNLGMVTPMNPTLTTNHAALLTNLAAGTQYYFTLRGTNGTTARVSPVFSFTTTNYVTTNLLFDFSNSWRFTTANLDGVAWTTRGYDDSAWEGPGAGLHWADGRGANDEIPLVLGTEMPINDDTGYPYRTYYLRTHFTFAGDVSGVALGFQSYIDDGAVFHLNGTEIHRLRMAAAPTLISNSTLAIAYPCSGNATCPNDLFVTGPLISTNLLVGDNVLGVEVHNYNAGSPDITFGLSASYTQPYVLSPELGLTYTNGLITLNWSRGGFILQQAGSQAGPWTDLPGAAFVSPFTTNHSDAACFFRLKK